MNLLIIGDIYGKAGRRAAAKGIAMLRKKEAIDVVIANGENMAHGKGMTPKTYREMRDAGVDFFTTGNHIFDKKDINEILEEPAPRVIRPANFIGSHLPGKGYAVLNINRQKIAIANLMGNVFMNEEYDNAFKSIDRLLKRIEQDEPDAILVDFHAEATSEKVAMKHYLDGRVSALWGTHTHIPTADAEITPKGMAYITDVGMTGPIDSVIGAEKEPIIDSFVTGQKLTIRPAEGPCIMNAVVIELTGFVAKSIRPIQLHITP